MGCQMVFLKNLLRNLVFLIVLGLVLYIINPDIMKQVYDLYWALFGPIVILMVIVAAFPSKRRTRR